MLKCPSVNITLILLCLTCLTLTGSAQSQFTLRLDQSLHQSYVNFSVDLKGIPDTRPTTWGLADFTQNRTTFHPPTGYRVRIIHISGDFVAWPKDGTTATGTYAEAGWGLKSTAPDGSSLLDYAYDSTLIWVQIPVLPSNPQARIHYDLDTSQSGLLGRDSILISQCFVAINTSGLTIHMEPTFQLTYRFEPDLP